MKDIPQTCEHVDYETDERTIGPHSWYDLRPVELQTPFSVAPGALNFYYPTSTLKVCLNCALVVGYAKDKERVK